MNSQDERMQAWKRLTWLNSRGGGKYNQKELADLIGTTQGGVSSYLAVGIKQLAVCRWIGVLFERRCIQLGLDPATVDASLPEPPLERVAA